MRLKDKVAVVTGSASGIGRAIADRFVSEGAVVIIADLNESGIETAVEEIKSAGGRAAGYKLDVSKREQTQEIMRKVVDDHDRIDILVNNAGISRYRPFLTATAEDWDMVLDVDLKGVFFCSQAASPQMIKQNYGRI